MAGHSILAGHQGALHAHHPRSERRWRPIHWRRGFESRQTNSPSIAPERRCHMAPLRRMPVTLAVAALLLVATATTALAGITATAVD